MPRIIGVSPITGHVASFSVAGTSLRPTCEYPASAAQLTISGGESSRTVSAASDSERVIAT